jgi:hypothetical protein
MLTNVKNLDNINDFPKVGLIYLENSGEKLLRFYLEKIFHINTGSNLRLSQEDLEDKWIVASDYPSRNNLEYNQVDVASIILLVRNPVDLIMSRVFKESLYVEEALTKIDQMIEEWHDFYKFWIHSPIPLNIVRYEDLIHQPEEILKQICKFLLGVKTLENSKLEYYLKHCLSEKVESQLYAYDLQAEDGKEILTNEVLLKIQKKFESKLGKLLKKFNYEAEESGKISEWMINFNIDNMVKAVELHDYINLQYLTATCINIKLG